MPLLHSRLYKNYSWKYMKKTLMAVVLFTQSFFLYSEDKIESDESVYTVYLIRHAEKDTHYLNKKNPPLNSCGIERSNQISHFFNNITLEEIYSTHYKRTNSTAAPIAKTKNIEVKHRTIINNSEIKKSITIAEKLMKAHGRIVVRKPGTESKIRVMGESENKKLLVKCIDIISKKIR